MSSPILHPQTLDFLQGIDDFNEKKFFELYKPLYLQIKEKFETFVGYLIEQIATFDSSLKNQQVKDCIFRIYKDLRRPVNRAKPYKINMGASIAVGGRKSPYAGYYLHIQNNKSFFCGGIWRPKSGSAYAIRDHIYTHWRKFSKLIQNPEILEQFGEIHTSTTQLKKANRNSQYSSILGDVKDTHPSLLYLAMKDWLLYKDLDNEIVLDKNFANQCIAYAKIVYPFNQFLNTPLFD